MIATQIVCLFFLNRYPPLPCTRTTPLLYPNNLDVNCYVRCAMYMVHSFLSFFFAIVFFPVFFLYFCFIFCKHLHFALSRTTPTPTLIHFPVLSTDDERLFLPLMDDANVTRRNGTPFITNLHWLSFISAGQIVELLKFPA